MKKLMIAAAIVCAAAFANAATGNWGTGWTYWTGEGGLLADDTGSDDFVGNAYLFILTSDQYSALTSAETIWNGFTANGDASTLKVGDNTLTAKDHGALDMGGYDFIGMASEEFPMGDVYAAVIITHETEGVADYYSANTITGEVTDSAINGIGEVALAWSGETSTAATTWQSVPEPTSGLLLLLGVAGLALRRRRA